MDISWSSLLWPSGSFVSVASQKRRTSSCLAQRDSRLAWPWGCVGNHKKPAGTMNQSEEIGLIATYCNQKKEESSTPCSIFRFCNNTFNEAPTWRWQQQNRPHQEQPQMIARNRTTVNKRERVQPIEQVTRLYQVQKGAVHGSSRQFHILPTDVCCPGSWWQKSLKRLVTPVLGEAVQILPASAVFWLGPGYPLIGFPWFPTIPTSRSTQKKESIIVAIKQNGHRQVSESFISCIDGLDVFVIVSLTDHSSLVLPGKWCGQLPPACQTVLRGEPW